MLHRTTEETDSLMLYALHEAAYYASTPLRIAARTARDFWGSTANPMRDTQAARTISAGADLFANLTRRYGKPDWNIDQVMVNAEDPKLRANRHALLRRLGLLMNQVADISKLAA